MSAVYVFGLTGQKTATFTCSGHRIEFLDLNGLYAAIERRTHRPEISESALRMQHDIVMRMFGRVDDLLPARFGAWIDERELDEIMTTRRIVLREALDLVRGRVQMTVRFRETPQAANEEGQSAVAVPATGTAYLEGRRKAASAMPARASAVSAAVGHLVIAERSEPETPRTQASLYHLIDRGNVAEYSAAMASLQSPALTVSGPWPAFAFAPDVWP